MLVTEQVGALPRPFAQPRTCPTGRCCASCWPTRAPNDIDVAVVSDWLTRFDLAQVRLDLENESKPSINLFVFATDNERLPELRASGVPVFERVPA